MSTVCGRCKEGESLFECADCVGSKRRGELLPLCDSCNALIHVGFLEDHQVVSVAIKQKKTEFQEQVKTFKSQEKSLQLKSKEASYAKQDIEQRSQFNQQIITQAFQAVRQALKQKESELATPLKLSSKAKTTLLVECEKSVNQATSDFKSILKEADKLLQGNLVSFAQQHEQMAKKLEDFEVGRVSKPFPTLGRPASLDVTSLLQSIKDLCLQSVEDDGNADIAEASGEKEVEQDPSPGVQSEMMQAPKDGDALQVYVESRMDTKGRFWVSKNLTEDVANLYENLSFRIRQDILQNPITHAEIEEGMLCCCQFKEDHRWYRGRVDQIQRQKGVARIRWLDYAHENEVPLSAIQPLKEEFQTLPFQAMECSFFETTDEDVPHQARWEFSDHVANALLDCTILKQVSPDGKFPVYVIDLVDKYKDVDLKERVMDKIEEAKCKKDTIICRDIRYMKDYASLSNKASKKETAKKPKEVEEEKEQKSKTQTKEDETIDAKKNESKDSETDNKESQKDISESSKPQETHNSEGPTVVASEKPAGADTVENQGGEGDGGMRSPQQEKTDDARQPEVKVQEVEKQPCEAGSVPVKILKRGEEIPDQTKPGAVLDKQIHQSYEEPPATCPEDGSAKSQQSSSENANNDDPSGQGKQPSGSLPEGGKLPEKKKEAPVDTAASADPYSLEPGEDDEGDNPGLIEFLTRQGDQAMAHSPETTPSYLATGGDISESSVGEGRARDAAGDRPVNGEGSIYQGRSYDQYGSGGYHMATGMPGGGHQPPSALGLNPVESSTLDFNASSQNSKAPLSEQGKSTGEGFKIVVDSSFSINIATPLSDNGRFWASRLRGPVQESQLRRLMHDISLPCEPLTISDLKEVKVVCVQAPSGRWCRARVEGFLDNKVQVRYVDFGQEDLVEEQRIKALSVKYQLFPFQAIELSIANQNHPRFSKQAKDAFMKYTQGRRLGAKVVASESKTVYVALSYVDENQLVYDISSAILKVNQETMQSSADVKTKEKAPPAGNSHRGSRDHTEDHMYSEDHHRPNNAYDAQYDYQADGRPHDRAGERCFVCNNFGHLSYDCPKKGDSKDRNDRNYRNKGGSKKQNWGRKNRKY